MRLNRPINGQRMSSTRSFLQVSCVHPFGVDVTTMRLEPQGVLKTCRGPSTDLHPDRASNSRKWATRTGNFPPISGNMGDLSRPFAPPVCAGEGGHPVARLCTDQSSLRPQSASRSGVDPGVGRPRSTTPGRTRTAQRGSPRGPSASRSRADHCSGSSRTATPSPIRRCCR
jgi:hypothetical protein